MEKSSKTALLFVTTISLWIVHTAAPVCNHFLPTLHLSSSSEIQLPWVQILNQLVGVAISLSAYSWLHTTLDGRVSLANTLFFLFCGYLVTTGHGIHTTCVVLQDVMSKDNELYNLIDFLHERASHNMFVGGFYAVITAVMMAEQNRTMEWLKKGKSNPQNSNSFLHKAFFQWVWPLLLGSYFSIFACITNTVFVTLVFYACVIAHSLSMYKQLVSTGLSLSNIHALCGTQMLVFGTLAKTAVVGIPVLFLYCSWL